MNAPEILAVKSPLHDLPLDTEDISAASLNVETKARSNLFPWNGQFSPQFVEVMLAQYAPVGARILDPFCGSGTVLAEAIRLGLSATGIELNPAAFILARTYTLASMGDNAKSSLLAAVEEKLQAVLGDGWPFLFSAETDLTEAQLHAICRLSISATTEERVIIEAFVILSDFSKGVNATKLAKTWARLSDTIMNFPQSQANVACHHGDGRFPAKGKLFDLVFTSPPYINVYNYHQQYRGSAEALGWDLLHVAKTEIGSNRKNRGNRFLTVTQYCLDLAICLASLWSVTTASARLVMVMGRESRVRGVPFFNGEIAAALAVDAVGYRIALRQERVFTNRFGQRIFEDILHFQKPERSEPAHDVIAPARRIAMAALRKGLEMSNEPDVREDLSQAIDRISDVAASPQFVPHSLTT